MLFLFFILFVIPLLHPDYISSFSFSFNSCLLHLPLQRCPPVPPPALPGVHSVRFAQPHSTTFPCSPFPFTPVAASTTATLSSSSTSCSSRCSFCSFCSTSFYYISLLSFSFYSCCCICHCNVVLQFHLLLFQLFVLLDLILLHFLVFLFLLLLLLHLPLQRCPPVPPPALPAVRFTRPHSTTFPCFPLPFTPVVASTTATLSSSSTSCYSSCSFCAFYSTSFYYFSLFSFAFYSLFILLYFLVLLCLMLQLQRFSSLFYYQLLSRLFLLFILL